MKLRLHGPHCQQIETLYRIYESEGQIHRKSVIETSPPPPAMSPLMSKNAGNDEFDNFGEILPTDLMILAKMRISLTHRSIACWPIWQFWQM